MVTASRYRRVLRIHYNENLVPNQIDQSIKIENTSKGTTLSLANKIEYTILIPAKVKRKLQELFRMKGRPRLFVYMTFAAGIVLLLQKHLPNIQLITIDIEYPGKDKLIEKIIRNMLDKCTDKKLKIYFERIGKKSKAHNIAYCVTSKKRKPDRIINFNEIKKIIFP